MPTPSEPLPLLVDAELDSEVCACGGGVEVGAAVVAGSVTADDFVLAVIEPVVEDPVVAELVAEEVVVDEGDDVGPAIDDVGPVVGLGMIEVGATFVVVAATVGFEVVVVRDGPWAR
jgi:hypothetical protein